MKWSIKSPMKWRRVSALACFVVLFAPAGLRAASLAVQTGDFLIVNHGDNSVYRINPVSGDHRKLGTFQVPTDLAVSPEGYLYVSEYGGTIQRLNLTNGTVSVVNPLTSLWNVNGMALGPTGDLYVTCASSNSVVKINPGTGAETVVSQGNLLSVPVGIDWLDSGHLAVSCFLANQVVNVSLADGTQSTIAQAINGLDRPWGLAVAGTNIYVAAKDSKWLQCIAAGTVSTVRTMASSIFGIGIEPDGDIIVGEVGDVARVNPNGTLLRTFPGAFTEITGVEVSPITVEALGITNTPPTLGPISDQTLDEQTQLTFAVIATETNWPPQICTFSLAGTVPNGAAITTNGLFTWTPSETQGPGTYPITVVVCDDGLPSQSATRSFTVTVNEVNTAPTMPPLINRNVLAGTPITFSVDGADADLPPQVLSYALLPGAPNGAVISAGGFFSWTPSDSQAPSTNIIRIKASDNGIPQLSATNSFTVVVNQMNVAPIFNPITNPTVGEGSVLSFLITASDANRPAQQLTFRLLPPVPAGATLSASGQFSWMPTEGQGPGVYEFMVQVTDSGAPPLAAVTGFTVTVNEVNTGPVLEPVEDVLVPLGMPVVRAFTGHDPDLPAQSLSFSLAPGAPSGAAISTSGLFTWTPTDTQALGTNFIDVIVSDAGVPSLSATQTLTVVVRPGFRIAAGDILIVDYGNNEVLQVNPESGATQSLGIFDGPTDVALAPDGNLYVAEVFGTVRRLNLATQAVTLVNTNTTLYDLWGIAIAPSGHLLALNRDDNRIVRIDPATGNETLLTRSNLLSVPYALDLLDPTHLVVSSFGNNRLVSVELASGSQTLLIESNSISSPSGVASSPAGIYVGSWDQGVIQRVSDGVVTNLCVADGPIESLDVETNGAVIAGVSGPTTTLMRMHPDGRWSNLLEGGVAGPITGIDIAPYSFAGSSGSNTPPVMAMIPNCTIDEGSLLTFTAAAADADVPAQTLSFSLDASAPMGATITPGGVFQWTPGDSQGPANYSINVIVTDNGSPPLSTTNHFTVTLNELYLQSAGSAGGAYSDEPAAAFDRAAQAVRVQLPATTSRFYRLRCNLPVRIKNLRLVGGEAVLEYKFQ